DEEGYASPSGVGYDIGCVGRGTRVTSADGQTMPIEGITSATAVACLDGGVFRRVEPHSGALCRGRKPVQKLTLTNGRSLMLTSHHRVLTPRGWIQAPPTSPPASSLLRP